MPNEGIDVGNLEALEKYRSFTRYFRQAEKEGRKARWWRTYRQYASPEPGTRGKGSAALWLKAGDSACCWGRGLAPNPGL